MSLHVAAYAASVLDYVEAIRRESARFAECLGNGDWEMRVPSCPEWNLADLTFHLAEVQHYWATIADQLLLDPDNVTPPERPADDELTAFLRSQSSALAEAVSRHPAEARCWSWHDDGWNIGWIRRRQAHEALIHRVDAELATGHRTAVDAELAADGIDELLYTMIDGVPDWASFIPDETTATISVDDGNSYGLRFGRIVGIGPESGTEHDFDTFLVVEPTGPAISGSAVDLDLWLWGRGTTGVRSESAELVDRIRAIVAGATQ